MEKNSILAYLYCALLTLLVVQGVSGALLTLNYIPVMENQQAITSVKLIGSTVKYGWFFQTLHKQGVHLIVIVSLLGMVLNIRKEQITFSSLTNWWSSVMTVLFVFIAIFTGNILVGDGYASQSFQIGGNIVKEIPLIGSIVHFLVFSPNQQELHTFSLFRMFVSHILFIPVLLGIVLLRQKPKNFREVLTPNETVVTVIIFIVLQIFLSLLLPDNDRIVPYQPDWFFLPIHFLQHQVPSMITGLLLGGILIGMLLLPVFNRKNKNGL